MPPPRAQVLPPIPPGVVQPGAPLSKSSLKWMTGVEPGAQSPGAASVEKVDGDVRRLVTEDFPL